MGIRLLHDWVMVRLDKPPTTMTPTSTIIVPDVGAGALRMRTGVLLQVGPGRWAKGGLRRLPVGLEVGEKVAFFRENLEHQQGKQLTRMMQEMDEDTALIRAADVLYVMGGA